MANEIISLTNLTYCPLVSVGSRSMKIKNSRKAKMAFGKNFDEGNPP